MNTEQNNQQGSAGQTSLDFIAIGDMVIDAFIRLNDDSKARVIDKENGGRELAMPFGDKIPFEFAEEVVAVGNSANAAVAAARLGLTSGLVVNVGKDRDGEKCIAQLNREGVSTAFVKEYEGKKTNYHYVLWYKDERTILIKHETFDYTLPDIGHGATAPKCIYLSSISENALPYHDVLADYLEANPEVKLVFQPGTFQIKWGTDALKRIYKRTDVFFCNVEEAERILGTKQELINKDHMDAALLPPNPNGAPNHSAPFIKGLLDGLRALGPKLPIITDGPNGAYTYASTESNDASGAAGDNAIATLNFDKIIHLGIYPDIAPPYERTGAGDAFASTFSAAYLLGNSTATSLKWGSINSMNVCQHVGAQKGLLKRVDIEAYLAKAPAGWDVQTLS